MQVTFPSGDPVWVSIGPARTVSDESGAADVGLRDGAQAVLHAGKLPGFAETVRGVVASVREALDEFCPDEVTVDFGIEITARTGGALSVLAQAGGSAQIKVSASWGRAREPAASSPPAPEDRS